MTYLDHAAATPMKQVAIAAMQPFFRHQYANPSGSHRFARQVRRSIDESRDAIAELVGVAPGEVIFTGGGTEANNTVIAGVDGVGVCSAVEHPAVLEPIVARGGRVVGCDTTGHIDLDQLEAVLDGNVGLVSVMAVNNEVGTITRLDEVARRVRRFAPNALFHVDAVQAACWLDLRPIGQIVDAMSLSAHKFGGPKGVGVLTLAKGTPMRALLTGGGQEREMRSGTHNVAGIVAMAAALAETDAERDATVARIRPLRDALVDRLLAALPDVVETVGRAHKVAGAAHMCFAGVENESLLYVLDQAGVCASAASSCASGAMEPSHVLAAMGVDRQQARGALRLTLGAETTVDDVDHAVGTVVAAVQQLRERVRA